MKPPIKLLLIVIILAMISLACGSTEPTQPPPAADQQQVATTIPSDIPEPTKIPTAIEEVVSSRCVPAGTSQLEWIQDGIDDIIASNYIKTGWAVRSTDFKRVWMVAAKIYGPNMEYGEGPGVWAMGGELEAPAMIMSVNGFAKEFSPWPDAGKTDAAITLFNDGVQEAIDCANND